MNEDQTVRAGGGGEDEEFDPDLVLERLEADLAAGLRSIPPDHDGHQGWVLGLADDGELAELGIGDLTGLSPAGLRQGGPLDELVPGPVLAAALGQLGAGTLNGLADIEVLGLMSGARRLMSWSAWVLMRAEAEFANRNTAYDERGKTAAIDEFAREEVASKLHITGRAAEDEMYRAQGAERRLPQCLALLRDGAITDLGMKIIAELTANLTDAKAARADKLIAAQAAGRTPGSLRRLCTKIVLKTDPEGIEKNRRESEQSRRVEVFQEHSGNGAVSVREIPVADALTIKLNLTRWARIMRAAGFAGSLDNLRADASVALLLDRDPVTGAPRPAGSADARGPDARGPGASAGGGPWDGLHPANQDLRDQAEDPGAGTYTPWDFREDQEDAGEADGGGSRPGGTGPRGGNGAAGPATHINILVTAGLMDQITGTPAEIGGFGYVGGQPARDLIEAASRNPGTRWCVTEIGPDGTATAHGCARGQHPWTAAAPAGQATADGAGKARDGPGISIELAGFLASLNVTLEPIARGGCDHRHYEPGYRISRNLRHLIQARTATCTVYGCGNPADGCDADHTVRWPGGPSCECNLAPLCRRHHRMKQAKGWTLEQAEPGKRGSYCPPVQAFDGLRELVAVPAAIRLRHSASVSGVRVIQSRVPGPRRAVRMPSLIQV